MLKNYLLSTTAVLLLTANCAAADTEGASGAQFLRIGVDAKASALGEAGSVSEGARSMFYNPAGLNSIKDAEISVSQVQWVQNINYSNLALAKRSGSGVFGLGVNYLSTPATDKYDKFGNKLSDKYSDSDLAVALGYARELNGRTGFGMDLKYVSGKLESESASAVAADAGIKYQALPGALTLGLAVQNLGTRLKYRDNGDPLPLNLKLGGEYLLKIEKDQELEKNISFFSDLNNMKDSGLYMNFGVDLMVNYAQGSTYSVRCGYRTNSGIKSGGPSLGLGIGVKTFIVDYAYSPMGDLGRAHRISLTLKFDAGTQATQE